MKTFVHLLQPSLLPFSKDTIFYLYYIVNINSMYTYHFLFNSSSNSSTCCNVSPFINEKSVVSSLSSLKNHCHNLLSLQSPLRASVGMIVRFYTSLSKFALPLCIVKRTEKFLSLFTKITMMYC